jgi:hypothetical protein
MRWRSSWTKWREGVGRGSVGLMCRDGRRILRRWSGIWTSWMRCWTMLRVREWNPMMMLGELRQTVVDQQLRKSLRSQQTQKMELNDEGLSLLFSIIYDLRAMTDDLRLMKMWKRAGEPSGVHCLRKNETGVGSIFCSADPEDCRYYCHCDTSISKPLSSTTVVGLSSPLLCSVPSFPNTDGRSDGPIGVRVSPQPC